MTRNERDLQLYNTLSRKKEAFTPLEPHVVRMYNCGPTVYNYAHIGNLRAYVTADILRRTLEYSGYEVRQVINITDVGHLTTDADEGEDKMEVGAAREGKTAADIATFYTDAFFADLKQLNIKTNGTEFPRASAYIAQQIQLVTALEKKGFTYKTSDGIYFDTSKDANYGTLARLDTAGLKEGARVEKNDEKRSATDFALWKFSRPDEKRQQEWDSPWSTGYPGWHAECSAMAQALLGETIDIHTGGIDHIPVHHTNEIAQSENATGKQFSRFWLHSEFVNVASGKMAKSADNFLRLQSIIDKNYHPLTYRYWLLTGHYRSMLAFSWETLDAAHTALRLLYRRFLSWEKLDTTRRKLGNETGGIVHKAYVEKCVAAMNDDLNTPQCIAHIWEMAKDKSVSPSDKHVTLKHIDQLLGLGFNHTSTTAPPFPATSIIPKEDYVPELRTLVKERKEARAQKNWDKSDELRDAIASLGYTVKDTPEGMEVEDL